MAIPFAVIKAARKIDLEWKKATGVPIDVIIEMESVRSADTRFLWPSGRGGGKRRSVPPSQALDEHDACVVDNRDSRT
jgi:hypothetical protein